MNIHNKIIFFALLINIMPASGAAAAAAAVANTSKNTAAIAAGSKQRISANWARNEQKASAMKKAKELRQKQAPVQQQTTVNFTIIPFNYRVARFDISDVPYNTSIEGFIKRLCDIYPQRMLSHQAPNSSSIVLSLNGKILKNRDTLRSAGVKSNDTLMVLPNLNNKRTIKK